MKLKPEHERYSRKHEFHYTSKSDYDKKLYDKEGKKKLMNPKYWRINRSRSMKGKYGITLEEKEQMTLDQDNKCLRCGLPFEGTAKDALAPSVDHDHSFGNGNPDSVRGIVHNKCNTKLGVHNDSIEDLQLSIDYLKKHGVKK